MLTKNSKSTSTFQSKSTPAAARRDGLPRTNVSPPSSVPPDRYICKMTVEIRSGRQKIQWNINHKQSKNSIFQPGKYPGYPVFSCILAPGSCKAILNQSKGTQKPQIILPRNNPKESKSREYKMGNELAHCSVHFAASQADRRQWPRTGIAV